MEATNRTITTLMALFMASAAHQEALAANVAIPMPLVIQIVDYVNVPPGDLRQAQREASRIYADAGVPVRWAAADDVDGGLDTSPRVRVLLLCRDMAARKIAVDHVADGTLGQATGDTGWAYVFYDRVRHVAATTSQDFTRVLGRVIAHEVGHLVLPRGSHSSTGIMRAEVDWSRYASMRFTPAQTAAIHATLAVDRRGR